MVLRIKGSRAYVLGLGSKRGQGVGVADQDKAREWIGASGEH